MGLADGALECFSGLLSNAHGHIPKKRKEFETVELKVRMDCDGCERKVKHALYRMIGVESVDVNMKLQKVTVKGYMDPEKVLKKVKSTGKRCEIWPYVPYSLVNHPYTKQSYDKKAPAGMVRKEESAPFSSQVSRQEDQFTMMFSDENPNACSIM